MTDLRRFRALSGFQLLLILVGLSGCGISDRPTNDDVPPDIVLISIDTLRADHLGCYGYNRETTPNIDRFAAAGTIFTQATANSPWTLPSHASLLTGLYPTTHAVRRREHVLALGVTTLASRLATAGYSTVALVNSPFLGARHGLSRGFERLELFPPRKDGKRVRSGAAQVAAALSVLDHRRAHPLFLFIHFFDVHSAYDPEPRFAREFVAPDVDTTPVTSLELKRIRRGQWTPSKPELERVVGLYDGGIRQLDSAIAPLLDRVLARSGNRPVIAFLASDHGEEFLEHGGALHSTTLYEELLHVPLIVVGPGWTAGAYETVPVQLSDVAPTLLSIATPGATFELDGTDLVQLVRHAETSHKRAVFAEADQNRPEGDDVLRMARVGPFKLIENTSSGVFELYDLAVDRDERHDISSDRPPILRRLRITLDDHLASATAAVTRGDVVSAEEEDDLRALGYLD